MKRYHIDPFGCVKNQVDAENMMAHLNGAGWESVLDAEAADLIIVNSCGFIESAKQESINAVLEWRKNYPNKKILLAGCLYQRYAKELPDILKEANGFIGIVSPARIVQAAENIANASLNADIPKVHFNRTGESENDKISASVLNSSGERPLLSLPGSAYVKITDGCDNCCSYCAIPLIRGSLISRPIPDIIEECKTLLKRGIIELNIIGQDIGAYGEDFSNTSKLPDLLNEISKLEGNFWVRLLYIHPDHFPLQILDTI
ncbi:MAG: 30S ribosomal protein S12 methylthiotransferase RimO, partial [Treponema sp.]|nr:30S ribosomal protein S12 methylthiotransferase RimO [Treponema sp.]